jgi:hypothetical protein
MATRFKRSAWLPCVIPLAAVALLIAACGGSSSTRSAAARVGRSASGEAIPYKAAQIHRDVVRNGLVTHRAMRGTGGAEINDDNPRRADSGNETARSQNPCTLVSRAQARAIVGRPIAAPVEAPLGPTCIYRPAGAKNFIILTVESIDFATIRAHIRNRTRFDVGGHTAYCGTYGQPTTFVPLAGGRRVLSITAPCAIGSRFAAKALSRLKT